MLLCSEETLNFRFIQWPGWHLTNLTACWIILPIIAI